MLRVDKTINSNNNGGRKVFHVFLASRALSCLFQTLNYAAFRCKSPLYLNSMHNFGTTKSKLVASYFSHFSFDLELLAVGIYRTQIALLYCCL
jgi:hypothetical protein